MTEAGDREVMKAMEEVTANNVRAAVAHGNETRKLFRELEAKVVSLDGLVRTQQEEIKGLKQQLSSVQAKVFRGGTT